ncbi:reverse transcriptase domain-containing protein [Tanacetum coccineum]
MVIDKSWTSLGKHEKAFYTGLKKFVDDCKPLVDSAGNIRCPCKSCRLVLWVSIKHLSDHISKYGFDPSYKTWIHHGEPDLPPPPPVIDNTRQPQMSDMTACLNDLSYIPLNNEQNEPTQGDIGETSNDPTQAKRNEFEELYASANEELYPGCDHVTRLDFMAKFTYFKVKGKLTDSIFNEMLEFFQNVFPTAKGYKLPPSYYAIKKTFKTIGLGYESIHACVNDCFLFRGDANKDVHFCPVCNTSRWKDNPVCLASPHGIRPDDGDHKTMQASSSTCKRSTMARRLLSKKDIRFRRGRDLMTWSASDPDVPRKQSEVDWDAQLAFWNDPKNLARAAQNKQNRAKLQVRMRHGIPCLYLPPSEICIWRPQLLSEVPSLIHTFFLTHTVGGVFLNPEDKALYPHHSSPFSKTHSADIARLKKREKRLTKQVNMFMRLFRSDDKFSQMLNQLELQPEYGGGSGSGGCEDDEPGDDEDGGEDEEVEDDS